MIMLVLALMTLMTALVALLALISDIGGGVGFCAAGAANMHAISANG